MTFAKTHVAARNVLSVEPGRRVSTALVRSDRSGMWSICQLVTSNDTRMMTNMVMTWLRKKARSEILQ